MSNRLNIKEDQRTEFKLTFQEKVIETLVAFANTSGGVVYVGVRKMSLKMSLKMSPKMSPKTELTE